MSATGLGTGGHLSDAESRGGCAGPSAPHPRAHSPAPSQGLTVLLLLLLLLGRSRARVPVAQRRPKQDVPPVVAPEQEAELRSEPGPLSAQAAVASMQQDRDLKATWHSGPSIVDELLEPPLPTGDDSSGSGSGGGCLDDVCGRKVSKKSSSSRTPLTHALPGLSEREGQKTSAASRPCPHTFLLLLLLTLVLTAAGPRWR